MAEDYGKTLNLPETEFSMRANLPQREPEILKKWQDENMYEKLMENNEGNPLFILHDGPPYANGDMHMGHALNKTLKDVITRFKNMDGFKAPYIHGWDTHGLPIERQAIKKLGVNRHEVGIVKFRDMCREFALSQVENQKSQIKRLGALGDWDDSYLTLAPEFEAKQVEIFGEMAKKGYIYKGLKPIYWCTDCETALAEAEIEYEEDKTSSIYVKFRVSEDNGVFDSTGVEKKDIERGQVLAAPKSITPHTEFEAEVYVLKKEEGGRHKPFFNGYRPQFYFRTTDVTGTINLPEGVDMVMPGDNVTMTVSLICPIALEEGLRFAIREGGKTVGSGIVTKIIK